MVQNVNKSFHQDIEEGLIEVILVNETFYPSVNITLQITFTESLIKGQLISKCPFGVIVSTKIQTKKFDNFCPRNLRRGQIIR